MCILARFNDGNKLPSELGAKIEDFFEYYWKSNRLSCFVRSQD